MKSKPYVVKSAHACMQGPPKGDWDYLKPESGARVVRERAADDE